MFKEEIPLVLGYGNAVVISGSMEPAIYPGDIVIIRKQNDYDVGDIITFKLRSHITHRIIERTTGGFITQGDANNTRDAEINEDQVVGKVVRVIPKAGHVIFFLQDTRNLIIIALISLTVITFVEIYRKRS